MAFEQIFFFFTNRQTLLGELYPIIRNYASNQREHPWYIPRVLNTVTVWPNTNHQSVKQKRINVVVSHFTTLIDSNFQSYCVFNDKTNIQRNGIWLHDSMQL